MPERNFPEGRLNDYQKHKVRAWTTYDLGLGRLGNLNLGLLWRYDSALTYSLAAGNQAPSDIQLSRDPGYAQPPGPTLNVFFGERGVGEFAGGAPVRPGRHLRHQGLPEAAPLREVRHEEHLQQQDAGGGHQRLQHDGGARTRTGRWTPTESP